MKSGELATFGLAAALLAGAVAVRGIRGDPPIAPSDRPREASAIAEPMQLLRRGAEQRIGELSERVSPDLQREWDAMQRALFQITECPMLVEWLSGPIGLRLERLLGDLRRGSRDDALAALALIFQLGRATEWKPGVWAKSRHADRLGSLLEDWLRAWGERAADDSTLSEPALAALCLWARASRTVVEAPVLGSDDAARDRANGFLYGLVDDGRGGRTRLAHAAEARFPAALHTLEGLAREAERAFPEIDGDCGR